MASPELGVIKSVPIQTVWAKEATDFTPWLAKNLTCLSDKLGFELSADLTEAAVGDFSADILARDLSTGRTVIIENQYGSTDHKHLGQLITYAAGKGAGAVVWIAESIRPEHRTAIDLLNRTMQSTLRFYALEIRVIQIDNSRPAFSLEVICEPKEDDGRPISVEGTQLSETEQKYVAFFQGLIDDLRQRGFTNARKAQPQNWYTFSSENSGVFTYAVSFARGRKIRAEVYLDCGDAIKNKQIFDALASQKEAIEKDAGTNLSWERLDEKQASRVAVYRPGTIESSTEELDEIKAWAISWLEVLKRVFPSRIQVVCAASEGNSGN